VAKAAGWADPDAEARRRGERTGLDTPVVHAVNDADWAWRALTPAVPEPTREVCRLGSTAARLKLKGIDGGPHKRRSVRFNSTRRAEPYPGLTCPCRAGKPVGLRGWGKGAAWLSSARAVRCWVKSRNERNPRRQLNILWRDCPSRGGRRGRGQVSMTLTSGATRTLQWPGQRVAKPQGGANPPNPVSVRIGGCNPPP
jgi:hypothetical protein